MHIKSQPITELVPFINNARTHSDEQVAQIAASIREFGFNNPVLVDADNGVIAGHGRILAARKLGMDEVPTVRLDHLDERQKRAYILADNKLALNAGWDADLLTLELQGLIDDDFDVSLVGFSADELAALLNDGTEGLTDPDDVPEPPAEPVTVLGDVWVLGKHRLVCGDCTKQADVDRLLDGARVDLICTDPPYCSGGFQEIAKSAGSVGTTSTHKQIANDRLSTRGYTALLKTAFGCFNAPFLYAFTDWRMWVYLFDIVESSGYGVRSMIVWDKGTPGMGRGWRAQHELVMWASKETAPYPKKFGGKGNVIGEKRTGNINHTTEKPVGLIKELFDNAPFAETIADPFCGSGTALIAAEQAGRSCYGIELDPAYVDVAIKRWQDFTGQQATLDGVPFDEVRDGRQAA